MQRLERFKPSSLRIARVQRNHERQTSTRPPHLLRLRRRDPHFARGDLAQSGNDVAVIRHHERLGSF